MTPKGERTIFPANHYGLHWWVLLDLVSVWLSRVVEEVFYHYQAAKIKFVVNEVSTKIWLRTAKSCNLRIVIKYMNMAELTHLQKPPQCIVSPCKHRIKVYKVQAPKQLAKICLNLEVYLTKEERSTPQIWRVLLSKHKSCKKLSPGPGEMRIPLGFFL